MLRFYGWLLCLYPRPYRAQFAEEMRTVFAEAEAAARAGGRWECLRFNAREIAGLLRGAAREQASNCSAAWAQCLAWRIHMRSDFRYPVSSISFMAISLVLVVAAIEKATAIARSLPAEHPHVVIRPFPVSLPQTLAVMFAATYAAAVIVWAIIFAIRRAGVHRLSTAETWRPQ